jgi:thiamine transport system permease protein
MIGGGLALLSYTWKIKNSSWFDMAMIWPIFLPGSIVSLGFIIIWGNAGYANNLLHYFGFTRIQFLYSAFAVIASHCYYNIPFVYLAISGRLIKVNYFLEESAGVMGASHWFAFKSITWPRLRNTIIGVCLMVFIYSFMSFSPPLILGGIQYQTLEVYIYNLITQYFNFASAGILALVQFIGLIIILKIAGWRLISTHEDRVRSVNNYNSRRSVMVWLFRIIILFFLIAPIIGVLIDGFKEFGENLRVLLSAGYFFALARSLILFVSASALSLVVSISYIFNHKRKYVYWPIVILAISPVLYGLASRLIYGQSFWAMFLVYTILIFPVTYFLLNSLWEARPKLFTETLRILGSNKWQVLWAKFVYLKSGISKSIALALAYVLGDIAVANLLSPHLKPTAMSLSYNLIGSYRFGASATGMSLVLMTIMFFTGLIMLRKN